MREIDRSSFQSASRYSPPSLVEDGRILSCRELTDIALVTGMWRLCVSEHVTKSAQLSIMYCVYELIRFLFIIISVLVATNPITLTKY